MFFGTYEHTLDDKGRLVIPSKMREEAGPVVYIMKGFDGSLSIYKALEFERLVKKFNSLSFNHKESRDYLRVQLASTCELDVDKQGRIQLPSQLLKKYKIGKEVVVIGAGDHMEVWNKAEFLEYETNADKDFEKNAENLSKDEIL